MARKQHWHDQQQKHSLLIAKRIANAMDSLNRVADDEFIDIADAQHVRQLITELAKVWERYTNKAVR